MSSDRLDLPLDSPGAPSRRGGAAPNMTGRAEVAQQRRPRRPWPLLLLLLVVMGGAAFYWFVWAPPRLTPSSHRLDIGSVKLGETADPLTMTLANTGHRALVVEGFSLLGEGAEDFAVASEDCVGTPVGRLGVCTVALGFTPSAVGSREAILAVESNATREALEVRVEGAGTQPRFELRPTVIDFGRQAVGGVSEGFEVVVANVGSAGGDVRGLSVSGRDAARFRWLSNRCSGQRVVAGADCAARLAFEPRTAGPVQARLDVETEVGPLSVDLLGVGMAPGLWLEPSSVDFGAERVGNRSEARRVVLENTGNAPLTLTEVQLTGAGRDAFQVGAEACTREPLPPGGRCSIQAVFAPQGEGETGARLKIGARGLSQPSALPLTGSGTIPRLRLSDDRIELGRVQVGEATAGSITLQSSGSETVRLTEVGLTGSREVRYEGSCRAGARLEPGASCGLRVEFSPRAEGAQTATLRVAAADLDPLTVDVTGSGYAPPVARLRVSPSALEFPRLRVGQRSEILSLRVASHGTSQVRLADVRVEGAHAADFQMVPASCNGIPFLVPGSECVVGFRFIPRTEGERGARLVIEHDGVGGPSIVPMTGRADPP